MKKIIGSLVTLLLMTGSSRGQNVLFVKSGAVITTGGGVVITLRDMDLTTDGALQQTAGKGSIAFTGVGNSVISGASSPLFDVLQLSKTGTATLTLQQNIQIGSQLSFTGGLIDLNGNNILLQPAAVLNGESESSRITGPAGGYVQITSVLNAPAAVNPGNLGAVITSGQNLGSTLIRRGHSSQLNASGTGNSIYRYYDITPVNDNSLNATLRMQYFNAELNNLDESSLVIWKSPNNSNWASQGFTARDAVSNYVELSGITDFSRWTLSTALNPLPLRFLSFNVRCHDGGSVLTWATAQEENTRSFVVERSADGISWTMLTSLAAAGNSSTERTYTYDDSSPLQGTTLYRIAAYDLDGSVVYTDTNQTSCGSTGGWKAGPNPVRQTLWVTITATAASSLTLKVIDSKGALVKIQREGITAGSNQYSINMASLPSGTYFIVAEWNNGAERKTASVVKAGGN